MSDLRRQQGYLNEYLQRMRQAVTEVDLEITAFPPPKIGGGTKPIAGSGATVEEDVEEAMPVTVDSESSRA